VPDLLQDGRVLNFVIASQQQDFGDDFGRAWVVVREGKK
jgi:hypothetical protein